MTHLLFAGAVAGLVAIGALWLHFVGSVARWALRGLVIAD